MSNTADLVAYVDLEYRQLCVGSAERSALYYSDGELQAAFQHVTIHLWRTNKTRSSFDGHQHLENYVYRAFWNACRLELRDRTRAWGRGREQSSRIAGLSEIAELAIAGRYEDLDDDVTDLGASRNILHGWLARLSERERDAVWMHRAMEMPRSEVAAVMGIEPKLMSVASSRALSKLRRHAGAVA